MSTDSRSLADTKVESPCHSKVYGWAVSARVLFFATIALLLGVISEALLLGGSIRPSLAWFDDALVAVGAGVLVLVYERRQSQKQ